MTPKALGALYADVRVARQALLDALHALAHAARAQGADDIASAAYDAAAKAVREDFEEIEKALVR